MATAEHKVLVTADAGKLTSAFKQAEAATKSFSAAERNLQKIHIDSARSEDLVKGARVEAMYALLKLRKELRAGIIDQKQFKLATDQVRTALINKTAGINTMNKAMFAGRQMSRQMRAGFGQMGHQIQDIAVQLQMGQNAMLVFAQQGSQIASLFGPGGALVGAIMAVGGAMAMALIPNLKNSSKSTEELKDEILALADSFDLLSIKNQELARALALKEINELTEGSDKLGESVRSTFDPSFWSIVKTFGLSAISPLINPLKDVFESTEQTAIQKELLDEKIKHLTETLKVYKGELGMTSKEANKWIKELEKANKQFGLTDYEKKVQEIQGMPEPLRQAARHALDLSVALERLAAQKASEEGFDLLDIEAVEAENEAIFKSSDKLKKKLEENNEFIRKQNAEFHQGWLEDQWSFQQEAQKQLEDLGLMGEVDQIPLKDNYVKQLELVKEFADQEVITQQQKAEAIKRINENMQKAAISEFGKGMDALGAYNKKAFKISKAMKTAEAIMNTYAGANQALAAYPPPFSYMAAAGQIAFGMAQVAQIKSQTFAGRAAGGMVQAGQPYMVGEMGKEMFIPSTSGRIANNNEVEGGMGTTNINFSITTVDARGFDELLNSRRGQIVSMVNRAMHDKGRVGVTA